MGIADQAFCDICGKTKQKVNHWWCGYVSASVGYMVTPFSMELAKNEKVQSFCGQECVIQAVNRWMGENSK